MVQDNLEKEKKTGFFDRYRYDISHQRIVLYPDYSNRLALNIIALVLVGLGLMFLIFIFSLNIMINGWIEGLKGLADYPLQGYLLMPVVFMIPFIPKLLFSPLYNRQIIFDNTTKTIQKRTIFITKTLGSFSDALDISVFKFHPENAARVLSGRAEIPDLFLYTEISFSPNEPLKIKPSFRGDFKYVLRFKPELNKPNVSLTAVLHSQKVQTYFQNIVLKSIKEIINNNN